MPKNTIEELSLAMEKMYIEHNAQIATMSRMITTLARLAGVDPKKFAAETKEDQLNYNFANEFNKNIDNLEEQKNQDN